IPPSLVLIILADQLGRSIGDMYRGAMLPGLLLAGMYIAYVILIAFFRPKMVPAQCTRSEEPTSELQSLMRISYAVFCLQKTNKQNNPTQQPIITKHETT